MSKFGASAPEHKPTGLWFYNRLTGRVGEQVFVDARAGIMTLLQPYGEEIVQSASELTPLTKEAQDAYNSGGMDAVNDCEYVEPEDFTAAALYRQGYRHGTMRYKFDKLEIFKEDTQ